jgi:hypothetical protein
MSVTCQLHVGYLPPRADEHATRLSMDARSAPGWCLHVSYMPVTCQLHVSYMSATCHIPGVHNQARVGDQCLWIERHQPHCLPDVSVIHVSYKSVTSHAHVSWRHQPHCLPDVSVIHVSYKSVTSHSHVSWSSGIGRGARLIMSVTSQL